MQVDRRPDPQRRRASARRGMGSDGARRRSRGRGHRGPLRPVHLRRRGRGRRPRGLRAALASARIEDRKRIIDHIRRISIDQCVELGTMEMEETKIGRLPHKIEKLKTLGERTPGRRVPAERGLQRRPRPGRDRARPVRRDRRDHAGDALAAHAHRQRREHDRRRATRWSSTRIPAASASPPRACAASTRRSTATWASTT